MIEFEKITKHYGTHKVLDNVSFTIRPQEFVTLVGPSGAGKSTLIKLLLCEEKPTFGRITIDGKDIHLLKEKYIPYYRRQIGVVFQDFKLLPNKTVAENISFALEVASIPTNEIKHTVPKVLDVVGLKGKDRNYPLELSGGERQRVAIARAIVRQPKILIADEPTVNLFGTTVLLTTHNQEIVNKLRRRVVTIHDGKIVSDRAAGQYRGS